MADGALLQDEQKNMDDMGSEEGGCCKCMDRCCDCLGRIPCASTFALTLLLSGLAGFAASVIVAVQKTRDAFVTIAENNPVKYKALDGSNLLSDKLLDPLPMPLVETIVLSICVGMVLLSCIFLSIAFLSSGNTRRHLFGGKKSHNICGRITNGIMFALGYIVNLAWVAMSGIFAIPVFILAILFTRCHSGEEITQATCFNPSEYAITTDTAEICGDDLKEFCLLGNDAFPAYIAAYASCVIVVISTIHFLVTITANYAHIKKDSASSWHGGSEDYVGSTNTIENTKM
jgi:hypothetical protein